MHYLSQNRFIEDPKVPIMTFKPPVMTDYSLQFSARFETATRYYVLRCGNDLLGDLVVSRFWGGKASWLGGEKHQATPSLEAALKLIAQIVRTRGRRGYNKVPHGAEF
jgi:hypothetical protein